MTVFSIPEGVESIVFEIDKNHGHSEFPFTYIYGPVLSLSNFCDFIMDFLLRKPNDMGPCDHPCVVFCFGAVVGPFVIFIFIE